MSQEQIKSPAFQNAALQSERLRILGVLGFMTILVIVSVVRVFVIHTVEATSWVWTFFLVALVMAYEFWMLRKVGLALKSNINLGPRFWILSTILETSIPALAIAFLTSARVEIAYRPLATPAVLVFFILIILVHPEAEPWYLRTLRCRCCCLLYLCGFVSRLAASYSRCASSRDANQRQPLCNNASSGRTGRRRRCERDP